MTDRLHDDQLDREIRSFLAWQAEDVRGAPTAIQVARRIGAGAASSTPRLRLTPQLAWALLAGLLIVVLVGVAVLAGMTPRKPRIDRAQLAHVAVFLRHEVVGGSPTVVAVGVNSEGLEREIARLPNVAPIGAISPSGRLAIAHRGQGAKMAWQILNLRDARQQPIEVPGMEQFVEQLPDTPYFAVNPRGGLFWGPGERLAVLWYDCGGLTTCEVVTQLSFVDGRTGAVTPVQIPQGLVVLPYWAADGSGVFVGKAGTSLAASLDQPMILRADGAVVKASEAPRENNCGTGGFGFTCRTANASMIVQAGFVIGTSEPKATLLERDSGASFEIKGSFAGWLEVEAPAVVRPTAPPGDSWLAYSTRAHGATDGVDGEIFVVRDGTEPRRVAGGSGLRTICPSFSPDGTKLSYVRGRYVVVLSGDPSSGFHEDGAWPILGTPNACPAWSPSGDVIAVPTDAGGVILLLFDEGFSGLMAPFTEPVPFGDTVVAWGPAGMAAVATNDGIWLADGTHAEQISTALASSLAWSPDGSRLAFHESPRDGGRGVVSVLTLRTGALAVLGVGERPVWSPDGAWIAYQGETKVVIERADGTDRRWVGVDNAYGFGGWSSDGSRVLQMLDVSGTDFALISSSAFDGSYTVLAPRIATGSRTNWPNLGDVSWQAVPR